MNLLRFLWQKSEESEGVKLYSDPGYVCIFSAVGYCGSGSCV